MKTSKKSHDLIRQNELAVKKSQKHDANLQKNSVLFFQVGLIVCLLAAYSLLEMKFEKPIPNYVSDFTIVEPDDFVDISFVPETPKLKPVIQPKSVSKSLEPEIVPNDAPISPFDDVPKPPVTNKSISPSDVKVVNMPDDIQLPFEFVETVPIYPGCENEKTNTAKRKCMSDKISQLVQKQFDIDLASELGLSGKQVIRTQFKIDKTGHVSDIKIQALHPKLKQETERVINKIPEMKPGMQGDKPIGVIYTLPIAFMIQN